MSRKEIRTTVFSAAVALALGTGAWSGAALAGPPDIPPEREMAGATGVTDPARRNQRDIVQTTATKTPHRTAGAASRISDGDAGDGSVGDAYAKICKHYENRARFKARSGLVEFVTVLAEACATSVGSLSSDRPAERITARVFLDRLRHFHDTIIAMNMERVFGADAHPWSRPKGGDGLMMGIPQVSAAGEFLIAHHMGLVDALDAWLDTGVAFSIALRTVENDP